MSEMLIVTDNRHSSPLFIDERTVMEELSCVEEIGDRRFPISNMGELIHREGLSYLEEM